MKRHILSGVGAAMITPFKSDFSIDWEALGHMIDYVIDGGTDYIVALGTTAETPTLTPEEKNEIIRFTREHIAGRVPLVVGHQPDSGYGPRGCGGVAQRYTLLQQAFTGGPLPPLQGRSRGFTPSHHPLQRTGTYGRKYECRDNLPFGRRC